jgi:hypothetical protein
MNKFEVTRSKDNITMSVIDRTNGYSLNLLLSSAPLKFYNSTFDFFGEKEYNRGHYITARDMGEYDNEVKDLIIKPDLQYLEVGAGLGEFTPSIIRKFNGELLYRPIVIDPVNYDVMYSLIKFAKNLTNDNLMNVKLKELQDRCEIILDNTKVNLINLTLENALKTHPELVRVADVVVDNVGASHYMENHEYAWYLEKMLLKHNGFLFSEVVNTNGVFRLH